jgi:hypothetical protein
MRAKEKIKSCLVRIVQLAVMAHTKARHVRARFRNDQLLFSVSTEPNGWKLARTLDAINMRSFRCSRFRVLG